MAFPDYFSDKADLYAAARPEYPAELFDFIASLAPGNECAWDCGAGNGQASVSLARHFKLVCATDPSAEQIAQAKPCAGVEYSVQPAEATHFPAARFDAVCVAQALHWFDLPAFFAETGRVMKPAALFAAWGYSWLTVFPSFDAKVKELLLDVIAPDWPPQNVRLWNRYQDVVLPFRPVHTPSFAIHAGWTLGQLLAYVQTWSATRRAVARRGSAFFDHAAQELTHAWGAPEAVREVVMPLGVIAGING